VRAAVVAAGLASLIAVVVGQEALAAEVAAPTATPVTVAWWTSAQIAGAPVGMATLVADGGLQVANGSDGPVSIAAVRFGVPAASDATLVLHLSPGSTPETAAVVACPVTAAWDAVQGAPLAAAPSWDCSLGSAAAAYDPVARTMQWSLDEALVRDGSLDVMLLPVEAGLPFNVTAEAPGADAVRTTAHSGGAASEAPPTSSPGPGVDPSPPAAPGLGGSAPAFGPVTVGPRGPAAAPEAPIGLPSALPKAPPAPLAADEDLPRQGGRWVGLVLLVIVLAVAGALWRGWPLLPGERSAPEGGRRGIGRFARPRTDLPTRI
jgi:hypothetical protein